MKLMKRCFLVLIALVWFIIIAPYFVAQTTYGARYVSQLFTYLHPDYTITVGKLSHSFANPYEITLQQLEIKDKHQNKTYLSTKKLVLGLSKNHPLQFETFRYAIVENGSVTLSSPISQTAINLLQLNNVDLYYHNANENLDIKLHHVQGGLNTQPNQHHQLKFTAQQASYNDLNIYSLSVNGSQDHEALTLNQISGNINQGFFSGRTIIYQNDSLNIGELKINKINLQSQINQLDINELFDYIPRLTIQRLSVVNSSIDLPELMLEKGNLEASNLQYYNQRWQLERSELTFNAQSIVWQDELIEQPLLQWHNNDQQLIVDQILAKWNKGTIYATGALQNNQFTVNKLFITGLHYLLPENWLEKINTINLPDAFPQITIQQWTLLPSIIVDTNADFPFEFTLFEGMGNNLILRKEQNKTQIIGKLTLKAESATLNSVKLQQPDLAITLSPQSNHFQFSSMVDQGIIEGEATLVPTTNSAQFAMQSYFVNSQVLKQWQLVDNPNVTNKFSLSLNGTIQPLQLNGWLTSGQNRYPVKNQHKVIH